MKSMKKIYIFLLCALQIFHSGCATIVHGGKQTVHIETNPPGAAVTRIGRSQGMISPADLVLKRRDDYEFEIKKPGYKTEYLTIDKDLGGWFWMNFLSWGFIGILVDISNGAAYNLEPNEFQINLQKEGSES